VTKKDIPRKNYVILLSMIVLIICACFAFYNLYDIYLENKISVSPLSTKQVLYDDLKSTTIEMDADTFLVISYVQDEEVYNNELEIKRYLEDSNLIDNVTYLDITSYRSEKNFVTELNSILGLTGSLEIKSFPALIYYKEGVPVYKVDSDDHLINVGDFEQIVDMYELAS